MHFVTMTDRYGRWLSLAGAKRLATEIGVELVEKVDTGCFHVELTPEQEAELEYEGFLTLEADLGTMHTELP